MKRFWSASNRYAPSPRSIKMGAPPTASQARTGELTAPGIFSEARSKRAEDFLFNIIIAERFCSFESTFHISNTNSTPSQELFCTPRALREKGFQSRREKMQEGIAKNPEFFRLSPRAQFLQLRRSVFTFRMR